MNKKNKNVQNKIDLLNVLNTLSSFSKNDASLSKNEIDNLVRNLLTISSTLQDEDEDEERRKKTWEELTGEKKIGGTMTTIKTSTDKDKATSVLAEIVNNSFYKSIKGLVEITNGEINNETILNDIHKITHAETVNHEIEKMYNRMYNTIVEEASNVTNLYQKNITKKILKKNESDELTQAYQQITLHYLQEIEALKNIYNDYLKNNKKIYLNDKYISCTSYKNFIENINKIYNNNKNITIRYKNALKIVYNKKTSESNSTNISKILQQHNDNKIEKIPELKNLNISAINHQCASDVQKNDDNQIQKKQKLSIFKKICNLIRNFFGCCSSPQLINDKASTKKRPEWKSHYETASEKNDISVNQKILSILNVFGATIAIIYNEEIEKSSQNIELQNRLKNIELQNRLKNIEENIVNIKNTTLNDKDDVKYQKIGSFINELEKNINETSNEPDQHLRESIDLSPKDEKIPTNTSFIENDPKDVNEISNLLNSIHLSSNSTSINNDQNNLTVRMKTISDKLINGDKQILEKLTTLNTKASPFNLKTLESDLNIVKGLDLSDATNIHHKLYLSISPN